MSTLVSMFTGRMPTKGKYIAGKQVSRWDAESEKVDIEYKNLDNASTSKLSFFSGQKGCALKLLLLAACLAVGMIVGYIIRRNVHDVFLPPSHKETTLHSSNQEIQDYDDNLRLMIQQDLNDANNFDDHIRKVTEFVHLSGVGYTNRFIKYVRDMWGTFRFDSIDIRKYGVTLSYPNYTNPNSIIVRSRNSTVILESHSNMSNVHPEYMPFNAFSPALAVKGKLVYANYGTKADFKQLSLLHVNVTGKLVIIKYGQIHAANKVRHAENNNASGVIFYSDPVDFAHNQSYLAPHTWWLPGWAIQLYHVRYNLIGDPLTPGYAAINGVYRTPPSSDCYPKIPSQPISYNDAAELMRDMRGQIAPNKWFGGLNITYRLGPEYLNDRTVELTVNNKDDKRNISNLIAVIEGKYEKDKYIIVGAHIDSWTKGAVDAGSGYAVIWELARAFTSKVEKGWRPRRSILFALWDATKYGHIGSFEWVQEYEKQLLTGAVAYINLDAVIRGNYSFYAEASPLLYSVIKTAAGQVPCVDPDYHDMSVLQMWTKKFPDLTNSSQPRIYPLEGDSDHSPFYYYLGVPSFSPAYTFNVKLYKNLPTFPAYSTLEDTINYLQVFIDPKMELHETVSKVVSDVILRLADSAIIPLDTQNYISIFENGKTYLQTLKSVFVVANVNLDTLIARIDDFSKTVFTFSSNITNLDVSKLNEYHLHHLNHKLVQVPRVFIIPEGLPGQPQYRNILMSPHPEDLNSQQVFPGIAAALKDALNDQNWLPMKKQISYLLIALRQATDLLSDSILGETL
ncbi:N-acetylated-alpha-linked acidic dipeptidase 2-like [Mizuhopecten yessoensis]|uniref:N-acetylated-alpha-linked acidic dipeptidase 2-like n=1 Tax=Mizuhopecten yessoensis TaxID=6573 RepID=UPI000B45B287|nr:N-acetylated-alpha-linked acidic dipeptidase 2-like [Mizuhopecten yessoensis]